MLVGRTYLCIKVREEFRGQLRPILAWYSMTVEINKFDPLYDKYRARYPIFLLTDRQLFFKDLLNA